ncbi:ATP-dependent DNA helicase Q1 [Cryptotermes secundus]|uniref:ATP-dependent DNA helicase n=2 Tax=Cryptotermes secundus TaxID=105785 RepID=A0A2J7Q8Y3_9NEOP|nr:ATP-dependent DNA helicase Q1 isoform X1 [Cryptotermes secundus]PNF25033.1 ATP-dependent DNA helicase Q1 [Cryptotermes secundus]
MERNREYCKVPEEELTAAEQELNEVEAQLLNLSDRKRQLLDRIGQLKDEILLKKNHLLTSRDWSSTDFPWSKKVKEVLNLVFKLNEFRPLQHETINAAMSNEDVILIMPTGGGKSLCYQLPALLKCGVALVVSPLVSLMEDQLMALKALDVPAAMLTATSTKEEVKSIQDAMLNKNGKLKLLYVTPEKLAKSKSFMTKVQKMYGLGRLSLIAIDEVHCCSQWGHDFRPDYKFLGILKGMFPDVPILGLTATSTSRITVDVQKMLCIQGCLVLRASFNRPNLYYEVRTKASSQEECLQAVEDLLKTRYCSQSGIIYTTSIKDCEQLMHGLRNRKLRVGCYHANLEAPLRSKVHAKWLSGEYQAVVATIAFGLGIDKPDVRFVIHYSLSKSMENFYQESGRAGRDNKRAECILMYRLSDVFRISSMVFTQQTGLQNLYRIVEYCLDASRCRRAIIASHFDEAWDSQDCNAMCDHCCKPKERKEMVVTSFCQALYKLISNAAAVDTKLTAQKLLDAWYGKGAANLRDISIPVPKFSRETGEVILAHLLVTGYLQEDFHFTPYSTISYLKRGPKAAAAMSDKHNIIMHISGKSVPLLSSEESHKTERKIPLTSNNKSLAPYQKIETLNETMTKSVSLKTTRVPKVEVLDQRIASDDDIQVCGAEKRRSSWKRKVIVLDTDSDD